ncbi:ankyrin repeat-containing domain protein [Cristinia sonorae]|uniref:Ankyrin repeat-containing domain protein n=1 Tax=Cristinia sonorae TaxID=1940300 RepID=A0A8K0UR07_9AGAR|nr:ankyrin repeat-containing domain protein [Cristinia sonorae]
MKDRAGITTFNGDARLLFRRIVLVLGSVHLTLMAALGIWLWSNPRTFGTVNSCAIDLANLAILGRDVPFGSTGLRIASIVIYTIFLAPGLNLILPMFFFLGLYLHHQTWIMEPHPSTPEEPPQQIHSPVLTDTTLSSSPRKRGTIKLKEWPNRFATSHVSPIIIGLAILMVVNFIFLIDIELTLQRNRHLQDSSSSDEGQWGFGQILAMILLVLPLRDIVETILARRERRHEQHRKEDLTEMLKESIRKGSTDTFLDLIQRGADVNATAEGSYPGGTALTVACGASGGGVDLIDALLKAGANPNLKNSEGYTALDISVHQGNWATACLLIASKADIHTPFKGQTYKTAIQAACHLGTTHDVVHLLKHKADLSIHGGKYHSALQAACIVGNIGTVTYLLAQNEDPNIIGGKYWTALQAACAIGSVDVVNILIGHRVDPNIRGGEYGSAIQAACAAKNAQIVSILLSNGADPNLEGGKYHTALQAACHAGNVDIVNVLVKHHVNPNTRGGEYGTSLQAACAVGNVQIVSTLLRCGAQANLEGGRYFTALQAACAVGSVDIVNALLSHGADPHVQGGRYHTALQAACVSGNEVIVKILLGYHVDPNVQGGEHKSALQAACAQRNMQIISLLMEHGAIVRWHFRIYEIGCGSVCLPQAGHGPRISDRTRQDTQTRLRALMFA